MELKPEIHRNLCRHSNVLIVPSGIETYEKRRSAHGGKVLIVPSGIETIHKNPNRSIRLKVLIVPSGIETSLIVSYQLPLVSINCT